MLSKKEVKVINIINFDFLELLSREKGWNNFFYEIFKLLSDSEDYYDEKYKFLNLNIVFMDQIVAYVKYVNKEKVLIIENDIFFVHLNKAKYIVFCAYIYDENQALLVHDLYKKTCESLLLNNINYKLTHDEIAILDEEIKKLYKINYVIRLLNY